MVSGQWLQQIAPFRTGDHHLRLALWVQWFPDAKRVRDPKRSDDHPLRSHHPAYPDQMPPKGQLKVRLQNLHPPPGRNQF